MSFEPLEFLRHIKTEVDYLLHRSQGIERDAFMADEDLRRAFVRSLEIIGEASKRIPEGWRQRYDQIDWRSMAGMRDRLIHGYFAIDYDLVWGCHDARARPEREHRQRSRKRRVESRSVIYDQAAMLGVTPHVCAD